MWVSEGERRNWMRAREAEEVFCFGEMITICFGLSKRGQNSITEPNPSRAFWIFFSQSLRLPDWRIGSEG